MQELTDKSAHELKLIGADSAALINAEHEKVIASCGASRELARDARDRALRIGDELVKMKEAVGHGRFMGWVKVHCRFSHDTAGNYMNFANSDHARNLPDNLSLRQAMIALEIIPHRPREGAGKYRGGGIPSIYDPLNSLTKLLGAVDKSGTPQLWETDDYERSAVQRQYKPKLEEFIVRLFGVKVELPAATQ